MTSQDSTVPQLFDVFVSSAVLVVFAPLMLFVTLAIKMTSPGPVLYRSQRIGRGGQPFRLIKFRTMVGDADKLGPSVTAWDDPRITRIGRVLRRSKLDELPTFINVLRGEMRVVGPRPETPRWVALYTPDQRRVLQVHPGITSPATVRYRHEEQLLAGKPIELAYPPIMRHKLEIELEYLRTRSFWNDLKTISLTILAVFQ